MNIMASLPRVELPVCYNFFAESIGQVHCQRIGHGPLLRLGEEAASGGATPEETVRGFLKRVGRKPDPTDRRGAMLTDDDVAGVSSSELEEFAERTITENEYLYRERVGREEEETSGRPRTVFGDTYLDRQTGESAVDFLARAVAQQPERQAASAARTMSKLGVWQSSAGLLKSMFPLASRLANEVGASRSCRPDTGVAGSRNTCA